MIIVLAELDAEGTAAREHHLRGPKVCVGRAESSDLMLVAPLVSRNHVEIEVDERGSCGVRDLRSRNGTRLNGVRLHGRSTLRPGDQVELGGVRLLFRGILGLPSGEVTRRETEAEDQVLGPLMASEPWARPLLGTSEVIAGVRGLVERAAGHSMPVLVTGETGTGKELVARLLHEQSPRRGKPFVVVNCPAIPPTMAEAELFGIEDRVATGVAGRRGRLEAAQGGTLFFDEIGDLDPAIQAKLLRFLEDGRVERIGRSEATAVNARVVAATNCDLERACAEGRFRADLLHRLRGLWIRLPPLRERREDLPVLAAYFLERSGRRVELSEPALRVLAAYRWPGNVRELKMAIDSASVAANGGCIQVPDLPDFVRRQEAAGDAGGAPPGVENLRSALLEEGGSFWDVVRRPFLERVLSRDLVRELVRRLHTETGSYKAMAERMGMDTRGHKKLLQFLRDHGLRIDD